MKSTLRIALIITAFLQGFPCLAQKEIPWSNWDQKEFDKTIERVQKADAFGLLPMCGNAYASMSAKRKNELNAKRTEMNDTNSKAREKLSAMGPKAIPALVGCLTNPSHFVRWTVQRVLESYGQPVKDQIEKEVRSGRMKSTQPEGRDFCNAIYTLCASRIDSGPMILDFLRSSNPNCQLFAVTALGWMLPGHGYSHKLNFGSAPQLSETEVLKCIELMSSPDVNIRINSAWVLGKLVIKNTKVIPVLMGKLHNDDDAMVRVKCAQCVDELYNKSGKIEVSIDTVNSMIEHLEKAKKDDQDWRVRRYAEVGLRRLRHTKDRQFTKEN